MAPTIIKFIDPFTDFGFKRLFGNEPNKDLLISLLNSILSGRKVLVDLVYNKNEHMADSITEGSAIFDLTCTGADGERFIIEVQRGKQNNFKKRAIYYTSLLATGQAPRGGRAAWAYNLPEIYFIALLEDFSVATANDGKYVRNICLVERESGSVFYDGLEYIFLELVNFAKTESELTSDLDKWLYVLKNMSQMDKIPIFIRKTVFEKLFNIAEYSNMTKADKHMYNAALKQKWDAQNKLDYAREEGIKEGLQQGRMEERAIAEAEKSVEKLKMATEFKKLGISAKEIAGIVGLPQDVVEQL